MKSFHFLACSGDVRPNEAIDSVRCFLEPVSHCAADDPIPRPMASIKSPSLGRLREDPDGGCDVLKSKASSVFPLVATAIPSLAKYPRNEIGAAPPEDGTSFTAILRCTDWY